MVEICAKEDGVYEQALEGAWDAVRTSRRGLEHPDETLAALSSVLRAAVSEGGSTLDQLVAIAIEAVGGAAEPMAV